MKNCFSNPKYNEYIKDELFVKKVINERSSQERKDAVNAVLGIALAAAVFLAVWVIMIFWEG